MRASLKIENLPAGSKWAALGPQRALSGQAQQYS